MALSETRKLIARLLYVDTDSLIVAFYVEFG